MLKVLKVNIASSTRTSFIISESGYLDGVVHLSKEIIVVLVGIVDHLLTAMDEFKLDPALLVCPLEK